MTLSEVSTTPWFTALEQVHQRAIETSLVLLEREKKLQSNFSDYSFILFPIAKAYEGFLKKVLFDLHLITEQVYLGKRFRIGRALNPDISESQRDEWWLYDDLGRKFGEDVARKIWKAWISCRNHPFHYFPSEQNEFSLQQIEARIAEVLEVFELTWKAQTK